MTATKTVTVNLFDQDLNHFATFERQVDLENNAWVNSKGEVIHNHYEDLREEIYIMDGRRTVDMISHISQSDDDEDDAYESLAQSAADDHAMVADQVNVCVMTDSRRLDDLFDRFLYDKEHAQGEIAHVH